MKIGRNDACPCGSGRKYKKCCAGKSSAPAKETQEPQQEQKRVTLGETIAIFQQQAKERNEVIQHLGVFLLYADAGGDAWILEMTDSDCIQIASGGEALDVPLEESEETIMVDWSHKFIFKNRTLQVTSYRDKTTEILKAAPSQQLSALRKKILKKLSPEFLEQVHIDK